MNPRAIDKAKSRLRSAKNQLEAAEKAESYDAFKDAWYLFLIAAKNVYTTLEQGSKDSAQSRQWFGAKKNERRSDPLLQYLFQARDDDEHGLAEVTRLEPGSLAIGVTKPGFSNSFRIERLVFSGGKIVHANIHSRDGKPVLIEESAPHPRLISVTGRGNITYAPPTTHLGTALHDDLPITAGTAALSYLTALVAEAEARAT